MILYIENLRESTKKLLELINKFSKVAGHMVNTHKSFVFLHTSNEQSEKEKKFNSIYNNIMKNKVLRNKANQGGERLLC